MFSNILFFILGICGGILGLSLLHKKNQELLDKQILEKEENYETIIESLKNEILSYKDIVKSLNKDIETLKRKDD